MKLTGCLFIIAFMISCHVVRSQDFELLLESGSADASRLTEGYLDPLIESMGVGLTSGWYNTAATHQPLGFDLTVNTGWVFVPDKKLFYNTSSIDLSNTVQFNGNTAPTLFGPEGVDLRPQYRYTDPETKESVDFTGPEGIDLAEEMGKITGIDKPILPVPIAHLGIGLPGGTDIRIRFTPRIGIDDNDTHLQVYGGALQHDIKQYFRGIRSLPFDMALFVGYSHIKGIIDMRSDGTAMFNDVTSPDGETIFNLNSWTFQALISKQISVITFYGGVGYNLANADVNMNGTYEYDSFGETKSVTDPLSMHFENSGARLLGGFRLKFSFLTLHADYTFQEYNALSIGLGISVY